jgi:hypothetical protein
VHTNHLAKATHHTRSLLIATLVLAVLAVLGSVLASQASAYGGSENFCGSTLLGKAQICTSAVGKSTEYIFNIHGENVTNGNAVCVGPVTWNGKEYSAPYGYSCGGANYDWEFTPISSVAAAVENPNGPSEKIAGLLDWKEYPPVATTESASGIQPLQATLNGTLNPERSQADYYFQYGKTTSYGSSTSEQSAGSGTSNEKESATISGLEANATYHYRLVVKNGVTTVYGSDSEFKTPGPVEAATSSPSDVQSTLVKVNGTINPRGYDAKYYFQYGATTSYGKTTSEGDAGAGQSAVGVTTTLTGLVPGHIYHYRVVGASGGVTSYGSDRSFTAFAGASTSAFYYPASEGSQDYFVAKSDNKVHEAGFTPGSGWSESGAVSLEVATGTFPSAFWYQPGAGPQAYFVKKSDNKIHASDWTLTGGWSESGAVSLEVATGTSPSAFYNAAGEGPGVYFASKSDSKIHESSWTPTGGWTETAAVGQEVAAGTTTSAFYYPASEGSQDYFVRKSDNKIHEAGFTPGSGWSESGAVTVEVATGTSPSAFWYPPGEGPQVYFVKKSDNKIHESGWTPTGGWSESGAVSLEVATGISPSAFYYPPGEGPQIYFVSKVDNKIHESGWTPTGGWTESGALSSEVASGSSLNAFYSPAGEGPAVYFVAKSDHKAHEIAWTTSSGWTETTASSSEVR